MVIVICRKSKSIMSAEPKEPFNKEALAVGMATSWQWVEDSQEGASCACSRVNSDRILCFHVLCHISIQFSYISF